VNPPALDEVLHRAQDTITGWIGEELVPHALVFHPGGSVAFVAMPDMGDAEQRAQLRRLLCPGGALYPSAAIAVWNECWTAASSVPEEQELLQRLTAEGRLQEAPPHLLQSAVRLFVETPEEPVRMWHAIIGNARALGTWEERTLRYPRPSFRRYFPELMGIGGIA
jgi:hypothetical protein